jgi:hypothetical protein
MHGHHSLVQVVHDPERPANYQRDDQYVKGQRQHIVGVVPRRREPHFWSLAMTTSAIGPTLASRPSDGRPGSRKMHAEIGSYPSAQSISLELRSK